MTNKIENNVPRFTKLVFHPNDLVLNKYRIVKKIDEGGMGSLIYLAEEINDSKNTPIVIKVINRDESHTDEDWTKFHDECITSQRLANKKNIVNTYETTVANGGNAIIIVMEYVDGISLRKHLDKIGNFNPKEAIYYFGLILNGIKELHSFKEKIIHRDLKPENIIITKDLMNVKIIDFGISSVVIKSTIEGNQKILTKEDTLWGTYPYISPDILKMAGKNTAVQQQIISEQFDFFALGVIFYEMLIGEKPFKISDDNDQKVIKLPWTYDMMCISDIYPDISVAIENIIFRCIASKDIDLKYRYHSINEIINDLEEYKKNPEKAAFTKLLKPKNERTLQLLNTFNVQKQKEKERFFEKHWFYWLIAIIAIVTTILVIIMIVLHLL